MKLVLVVDAREYFSTVIGFSVKPLIGWDRASAESPATGNWQILEALLANQICVARRKYYCFSLNNRGGVWGM